LAIHPRSSARGFRLSHVNSIGFLPLFDDLLPLLHGDLLSDGQYFFIWPSSNPLKRYAKDESVGERIAVLAVEESKISPVKKNEILHVRQLGEVAAL
jgi:hypothetical protein